MKKRFEIDPFGTIMIVERDENCLAGELNGKRYVIYKEP